MCITAIANLMQTSTKEGNPRTMFSKDMDIIPFIESHWEGMTTMSRRVTQSWYATVRKIIFSELRAAIWTVYSWTRFKEPWWKKLGCFFFTKNLLHLEATRPLWATHFSASSIKIWTWSSPTTSPWSRTEPWKSLMLVDKKVSIRIFI